MILKTITVKKEAQFNKKGINSAFDLINYIPRRYEDCSKETGLTLNGLSSFKAEVIGVKASYAKTPYVMASIASENGININVFWFHKTYIYNDIAKLKGKEIYIAGKLKVSTSEDFVIVNPIIFKEYSESAKKIIPLYSKIPGMSEDYLINSIRQALFLLKDEIQDPLGPELSNVLLKEGYLDYYNMLYNLHFPSDSNMLQKAQERLLLNDLIKLALEHEIINRNIPKGSPFGIKSKRLFNDIISKLPFKLTGSQQNVLNEIESSMRDGKAINGVLQAEVGSGKTITALLAMSLVAGSGYQTCLMAPTKLLAQQHLKDFTEILQPLGITPVYLGGDLKSKEKKEALSKIKAGASFVIGTTTLLSAEFHNLAFLVIDEEQRFGLVQREKIKEKAALGCHSLSLSATPIPKTEYQIISGGLNVYTIQKPEGRLPVITGIAKSRDAVAKFITSQVKKGNRIYIVVPLIEELFNQENSTKTSLSKTYKEFSKALPDIRIGCISSRTQNDAAEKLIKDFRDGNLDVLCATSVIEVGISVPEATVMVIENPECFGLAQLHQLRGRVGRGDKQSYCVLETEDRNNERLNAFINTDSGYALSLKDLELRGAGEILSSKQHGKNRLITLAVKNKEQYEFAKAIAHYIAENEIACPLFKEIQKM